MVRQQKRTSKRVIFVKVLLVLVIMSMLGGIGYYVHTARQKADAVLQSALADSKGSPSFKKPHLSQSLIGQSKDPTAKWTPYNSVKGVYNLKYPSAWVQPANKNQCSQYLLSYNLYLGADSQTAKCDSLNQITVISSKDSSGFYDFTAGYANVQKSTANVDGVQGQRIAATASGQQPPTGDQAGTTQSAAAPTPAPKNNPNLPDGTQVVEYDFAIHGRYYIARYIQLPNAKPSENVLNDFDTMVTDTLHFESSRQSQQP